MNIRILICEYEKGVSLVFHKFRNSDSSLEYGVSVQDRGKKRNWKDRNLVLLWSLAFDLVPNVPAMVIQVFQ